MSKDSVTNGRHLVITLPSLLYATTTTSHYRGPVLENETVNVYRLHMPTLKLDPRRGLGILPLP